MINQIQNLIDKCDELTVQIISGEDFSGNMTEYYKNIVALLPKISDIYSEPEYADHIGDIPGWIEQVKRLFDAINGADVIFLLDVISYEMKENLKELKEIIGDNYAGIC